MTVKKSYKLGVTVWVYGISRTNNKLTQGEIIHSFTLEHAGYNSEPHYVVAIPNEIEALLEVRTWHNISQDNRGPVGSFRQEVSKEEADSVDKKLSQLGLTLEDEMSFDEDEPTTAQIHAALDQAEKNLKFPPLIVKENKSRRRYPARKKKNNAT